MALHWLQLQGSIVALPVTVETQDWCQKIGHCVRWLFGQWREFCRGDVTQWEHYLQHNFVTSLRSLYENTRHARGLCGMFLSAVSPHDGYNGSATAWADEQSLVSHNISEPREPGSVAAVTQNSVSRHISRSINTVGDLINIVKKERPRFLSAGASFHQLCSKLSSSHCRA